ncbi:DoxX family protein [Glaciihabitans sp. dw_435]|uniref:DoxX family protein n=1 Tax=Glaciihabitans sp. dw_435 TaxID=2720081 RepID=UPI001BD1F38C|nr:DoxX family protein [Glaciihabitans sp. dw_435]
MQVAYWIVAGLLAFFYLYSGGTKIVQSKEKLQPMMKWLDVTPMAAVRAIGIVEVLGAIGLILPPLTNIAPVLALVSAIGFVLVQIGAIIVHLARGEARQLGLNIGLLVLAGVAIWLATIWL